MVGQVTQGGKLVRISPPSGGNAREKNAAKGGKVVRNDMERVELTCKATPSISGATGGSDMIGRIQMLR